jgi:hypothetical protein
MTTQKTTAQKSDGKARQKPAPPPSSGRARRQKAARARDAAAAASPRGCNAGETVATDALMTVDSALSRKFDE